MSGALLDIDGLDVAFGGRGVLFGFSCAIREGERLGLVGESGSGKSIAARALIGLLPPTARAGAKRYRFDGVDYDVARGKSLARLRGRGIAMVLQDPRYALNPTMTAGEQIAEVCGRSRALELLAEVGLGRPERVFGQFPNELSGGMGQRVMIAMMLASEPKLLIADEPTSALDVTVAHGILELLDGLVASRRMSLLFISHDLGLASSFCDRLMVMYRGRVLERIAAADFESSTHPYTQGLLRCRPKLGGPREALPTLVRDAAWERP